MMNREHLDRLGTVFHISNHHKVIVSDHESSAPSLAVENASVGNPVALLLHEAWSL